MKLLRFFKYNPDHTDQLVIPLIQYHTWVKNLSLRIL